MKPAGPAAGQPCASAGARQFLYEPKAGALPRFQAFGSAALWANASFACISACSGSSPFWRASATARVSSAPSARPASSLWGGAAASAASRFAKRSGIGGRRGNAVALRPFLQLGRAHQRRHGAWHAGKVIGQGQAALFFIFDRIPIVYAPHRFGRAENMRVTSDQLAADFVTDITPAEPAGLRLNHGMERHLHQHIAEFFPQQGGVVSGQWHRQPHTLLPGSSSGSKRGSGLCPRGSRFRGRAAARRWRQGRRPL